MSFVINFYIIMRMPNNLACKGETPDPCTELRLPGQLQPSRSSLMYSARYYCHAAVSYLADDSRMYRQNSADDDVYFIFRGKYYRQKDGAVYSRQHLHVNS